MSLLNPPKINIKYKNYIKNAHRIELMTFVTLIIFLLSIFSPIKIISSISLILTVLLVIIELLIFAYLGINKNETITIKSWVSIEWFFLVFNFASKEPLKGKEANKQGYIYLFLALAIFVLLLYIIFKAFFSI